MSIPNNFCGFKTAYLIPVDPAWGNKLSDMIADCTNEIFGLDDMLLYGWEVRGTDISGAAGFVITFDIEHAPKDEEMVYIEKAIMAFGGDSDAKKWLEDYRQ